jgi:hypothetical protein
MYGQSDQCPCCKSAVETLSHVFSCPDPAAVTHRQTSKTLLESSLLANTPAKLVQMLLHGLQQWELIQCGRISTVSPLFRGSVSPVDTLLIQAFHNQTSIDWGQLLRGRISLGWGKAYQYIVSGRHPSETPPITWAKMP